MTVRAEAAIVTAMALVVTIAVAAPVLYAPSERIFGMEIVGRHHDPFTVMERFDRPIALGVYAQPLTDVPGALLARVSGPVAAYNWLVLLTFPLSAAAAYALARHLKLSPASAAVAAFAFAFSPFHLAQAAYHPHIAQTQWMALYFLALWRCLDASSPAAVGILAVSIAGVTLSNFYGGLIAAVLTPVAIAAYWFFMSRRQPGSSRRLAMTTGTLAVMASGGILYAWFAAHAMVANRNAFAFPRADLFRYSAKWWSYLVPPVEHPVLGGMAERVWSSAGVHEGLLEHQVTLGGGIVALGLVAVFAWMMRRRRQASLAAVPALAVVSFAGLVCSLSPERTIGSFTFVRPSAVLYLVVPMFRSYARFGVVVQLMAALLAGIGAEHLWRAGPRRATIACVVLLALAAAEYAVWPPALWRDVLPTSAHRWVARQPDPIHVLDCVPLTPESESVQWLTHNRIAPGPGGTDDCMQPNLGDRLSADGYTHVLIRRHTAEGFWFATKPAPAGLQMTARFRDSEVFAVTERAPAVYTARMTGFYAREYDESRTWRWMGTDASWGIVNRGDRPIVAAVDIDMTAFHDARGVSVRLDGREVQRLIVEPRRQITRIGPLVLAPGDHELMFHPAAPPGVADNLAHNGDPRALSFAFGTWHWTVGGSRP